MVSCVVDDGLVVAIVEGTYEIAELKQRIDDVLVAGGAPTRLLVDARLSAINPRGKEIEAFASWIASRFTNCGVVARFEPLRYGLARSFQTLLEQRKVGIEIFEDMDLAKKWLRER
jgi:hypothetical protein